MKPSSKIHSGIRYLSLIVAVFVAPACGTDPIPDTIPPTISFTSPAAGAAGVGTNAKLTATFDEAMTASTIAAAFTLQDTTAVAAVPGTATYDATNHIATFAPTSLLTASHAFSATITTAVKDLAGNAMAANFVWIFNTGATADVTPPTVSSTAPSDTLTGVALNRTVNATFSEAMDASTITAATFTLMQAATPVSGTLSYVGTTATLKPSANLAASTVYTATITTGAKDLAGNALAVNHVWTFTTGTTAATGPARVNLGMAGNYVILAKTGIDTVATSAVTGDLGASPIAATGITHFSLILDATGRFATSTQVTGKIYASDYATPTPTNLTTAVGNMLTAFADASGRAPDVTNLGAGNIGGLTLYPGVFQWGTDVTIPTDVTLSGGPNDVWIFQISGNLSVAGAKNIVLSGGALPKNIFWQIAGGAGLSVGAGAHFEGIVLAQTAINILTGATVNGRLLAQTAVNIQVAKVTQPAP